MSMKRSKKLALGAALLAFTLPVGLAAQTATDQEVNDLKQQVQALRAEMDAMKTAAATPKVVPAVATQVSDAPAAGAPAAAATEAAPAPAPDPLAGITSVLHGVNLTALVDGYYQYNANHPVDGTYTEPFTNVNSQFMLNLLEVQLDKPVDKIQPARLPRRAGLRQCDERRSKTQQSLYGPDGTATTTQYLKEGYLSYMAPIGKGLQIDFGKFVTPAGVEVIESNQNWNYTRGLLFYDAIPYYHFGARVKYTFNDKWSVTGFATNGWNNVAQHQHRQDRRLQPRLERDQEAHPHRNLSDRSSRYRRHGNNGSVEQPHGYRGYLQSHRQSCPWRVSSTTTIRASRLLDELHRNRRR